MEKVKQLGESFQLMGTIATRAFLGGVASITGFLRAADTVGR